MQFGLHQCSRFVIVTLLASELQMEVEIVGTMFRARTCHAVPVVQTRQGKEDTRVLHDVLFPPLSTQYCASRLKTAVIAKQWPKQTRVERSYGLAQYSYSRACRFSIVYLQFVGISESAASDPNITWLCLAHLQFGKSDWQMTYLTAEGMQACTPCVFMPWHSVSYARLEMASRRSWCTSKCIYW